MKHKNLNVPKTPKPSKWVSYKVLCPWDWNLKIPQSTLLGTQRSSGEDYATTVPVWRTTQRRCQCGGQHRYDWDHENMKSRRLPSLPPVSVWPCLLPLARNACNRWHSKQDINASNETPCIFPWNKSTMQMPFSFYRWNTRMHALVYATPLLTHSVMNPNPTEVAGNVIRASHSPKLVIWFCALYD